MLIRTKTSAVEKPENPFDKKWQQIEKKQKRNATAKKKIEDLYQTFQEKILPQEQKVVALLAQETRHLITFLPRRSFTQWQREELQAWIESNLDTLMQHPFGDRELFETVSKEYGDSLVQQAQKINEDHDFLPEEIDDMRVMTDKMFQGKKEFTNEELEAFMRDPAVFQQALREFMEEQLHTEQDFDEEHSEHQNFQDDYGEQKNDYHNGNERYQTEQRLKKQNKLKSLFNSSKLNKLYKILANRLHPDKEINEHLKAEKSELMAKLVTAKKNKDAFTLISMFHQFIPESENSLFEGNDEELTQALIGLLNEKLHQLDQENNDEKYNNGIKGMIWQKLHGRSKKVTQQKINDHLSDLKSSHVQLNHHIHKVKTVKLLKEVLSERYEQRRFSIFDELDDFNEEFSNIFNEKFSEAFDENEVPF